jgi:hypothetical protein
LLKKFLLVYSPSSRQLLEAKPSAEGDIEAETNFNSDTFSKRMTSPDTTAACPRWTRLSPMEDNVGEATPSIGEAVPMGVTVVETFA